MSSAAIIFHYLCRSGCYGRETASPAEENDHHYQMYSLFEVVYFLGCLYLLVFLHQSRSILSLSSLLLYLVL